MTEITIDEKQAAIIEIFANLGDDWLRKYEYLIDLGRALAPMDPQYKTHANQISGCQSQIWLRSYLKAGKRYFEVACDAAIIKGIAALLVKILSGHTPEDIQTAKLYCLDRIGLQEHLSPLRSNGLAALVERLQAGGINPEP